MARGVSPQISDASLVRRCLACEDAAWELLVRRYANLVHAIAARSGLSEDEAADAFQAVFAIIWRSLDLLEEPEAIAGWIATIARREAWRLARGRARRTEREERLAADPSMDVLPARPPRGDEELEGAERAALVQHAVEGLEGRCREMLTLLFWETPTPSYDEIAERLDMPLGSVGPTRGRCLQKLRDRLRKVGFP